MVLESELVEVGVMLVMAGTMRVEIANETREVNGKYQYIKQLLAWRVNVTLAEVSRIEYSISPTFFVAHSADVRWMTNTANLTWAATKMKVRDCTGT